MVSVVGEGMMLESQNTMAMVGSPSKSPSLQSASSASSASSNCLPSLAEGASAYLHLLKPSALLCTRPARY